MATALDVGNNREDRGAATKKGTEGGTRKDGFKVRTVTQSNLLLFAFSLC